MLQSSEAFPRNVCYTYFVDVACSVVQRIVLHGLKIWTELSVETQSSQNCPLFLGRVWNLHQYQKFFKINKTDAFFNKLWFKQSEH